MEREVTPITSVASTLRKSMMNIFDKIGCGVALLVVGFCVGTLWQVGAFTAKDKEVRYATLLQSPRPTPRPVVIGMHPIYTHETYLDCDEEPVCDWTPRAEADELLLHDLTPLQRAVKQAVTEAFLGGVPTQEP